LPVEGVSNWSCGWLPSLYQGTVVRSQEPRILNLDPPPSVTPKAQERYLDYLQRLNEEHLRERPGETDLSARIAGQGRRDRTRGCRGSVFGEIAGLPALWREPNGHDYLRQRCRFGLTDDDDCMLCACSKSHAG